MGEDEGEEKQKRTVVVRAQDGDWVMGDDIILHVTGDETIIEIQEMIKAAKGVPITRMVVRKEEDGLRISDKHMTWSLSRNGLYDRAIILIGPTRPNQWLWHPLEWYEERLLYTAEAIVSSSPWKGQTMGCPLSLLEEKVKVPPPLRRDSLRSILRKFPDRLRLRLDLVSEKFAVFPNKEALLMPTSY